MSAAEFELALRGARSSNLASGMADLVAAVDAWMDDSDSDNVAALGHRRWCLNPPLQQVGFGRADHFFAMWAHDSSGPVRPEQPAICFPPPGCVPIDMFRPNYAWSITLDPRRFTKPQASHVVVEVRKLVDGVTTGDPIPLECFAVDPNGYGIDNCVIFRPVGITTAAGTSYQVIVDGLRDHDDQATRLLFVTTFAPSITPLARPNARE